MLLSRWTSQMQKVLNIRISVQNQTDIVDFFYLSITYFQFQFPLFVCFYSMADRT